MSHDLPAWGMDPDESAEALSLEEAHTGAENAASGNWPRKPTWSQRPGQTSQAMGDAQQSLSALLHARTPQGNSSLISPSGATRNSIQGGIVGPSPTPDTEAVQSNVITGYLVGADLPDSTALALPSQTELAPPGDAIFTSRAKTGKLSLPMERATDSYRVIRERAELLIGSPDAVTVGDEATLNYSRREAAKWATRYATHAIVVLVVGALVALGGFRSFTAQGAYGDSLEAINSSDAGTDRFDDAAFGTADDVSSPDFEVTLPRTELSGFQEAMDDAPSRTPATPGVAAASIVRHTVVEGDTIASVAAAYRVMPETVMGSNGIYEAEEALTVGSTLVIPPVDGIFYTVAEGDTIESIAQRFRVSPDAIAAFGPNNLAGRPVAAGMSVVVPGGMIPQRHQVLVYTVVPGDTLRGIAARYGVDVPTLLGSNNIPDPDALQIDSELRVLPVVGVEHKVRAGDTLASIAERYDVDVNSLIEYAPNNVSTDDTLQPDQVLMVPGARFEWSGPAAGAAPKQPSEGAAPKAKSNVSSQSSTESKTTVKKATPKPTVKPLSKPKPKAKVETKPEAAIVAPKKITPKSTPKPTAEPVAKTTKTANTPKSGTGRMVWPVRGRIRTVASS